MAFLACDMQACLTSPGAMLMCNDEAGGALDMFVTSPTAFVHPGDKIKIGELARRGKDEEQYTGNEAGAIVAINEAMEGIG